MFLRVVKAAHRKCPNLCIVMDNYSIHTKTTNKVEYAKLGIKVIWVPVGECLLNSAVEKTFLQLKTIAKRKKLEQVMHSKTVDAKKILDESMREIK